tara:strand:- start:147 stop:419 length:273 start_codon:yes stop_codon:yes gene_type:complete
MASCRFCLVKTCDTWFGSFCCDCHKLQRTIALFGVEKVCSIVNNVLIVPDDKHTEKMNTELAKELFSKQISLKTKQKKERKINSDEQKEI